MASLESKLLGCFILLFSAIFSFLSLRTEMIAIGNAANATALEQFIGSTGHWFILFFILALAILMIYWVINSMKR